MKQVNKEAYNFERYSHPGRWVSYYHQIQEVLRLEPKSVLEIGSGDGVFRNYLRENTTIEYLNIDVAEDLHPDVIGSVTALPFADKSYDVVCAFEVLEHIPFEQFERALAEMSRVARSYVVISLPHFGPPIQFLLKIPLLREFRFSMKIPFPQKHNFNGQHYWEIGKRGCSMKTVRVNLGKYFEIIREFVPFENQYHHFFILRKKHE
ncbi:MAG: methyltransferase domain-containing protein [Candidatus Yonathbacteria bacterium]|nr:methyltransferase domain-containing protein [Candidatus Yonathbacteria bacterium]